MNKKITKFIFFLKISLVFILSISFTQAQNQAGLDIKTKQECERLGGSWNKCPPNECQKTQDYQDGNVVCPQVCGAPVCQGILPETENSNLSDIHNPNIDHQTQTDQQLKNSTDVKNNKNKKVKNSDTEQKNNKNRELSNDNTNLNTKNLIFFLLIGLLFITVITIFKFWRKANHDKNS